MRERWRSVTWVAAFAALGVVAAWYIARRSSAEPGSMAPKGNDTSTEHWPSHTDVPIASHLGKERHAAAEVIPDGAVPIPAVQRDPTMPNYDASRLYGTSWSDAAGIFGSEPRKEPWASGREKGIHDAIMADVEALDPKTKVDIECHTESCRVRFFSEHPMLFEEMAQYPLVCMSSYAEPEFGDRGPDQHTDVYIIFGASNVTQAGFDAQRVKYCVPERETWLKRVDVYRKTGEVPE